MGAEKCDPATTMRKEKREKLSTMLQNFQLDLGLAAKEGPLSDVISSVLALSDLVPFHVPIKHKPQSHHHRNDVKNKGDEDEDEYYEKDDTEEAKEIREDQDEVDDNEEEVNVARGQYLSEIHSKSDLEFRAYMQQQGLEFAGTEAEAESVLSRKSRKRSRFVCRLNYHYYYFRFLYFFYFFFCKLSKARFVACRLRSLHPRASQTPLSATILLILYSLVVFHGVATISPCASSN